MDCPPEAPAGRFFYSFVMICRIAECINAFLRHSHVRIPGHCEPANSGSLRTSDRCHWCGNLHRLEDAVSMTGEIPTPVCALVRNDTVIVLRPAVRWRFPHQSADWFGMTCFLRMQPAVRGRFPHQFENWFGMTRFLSMRPAVRPCLQKPPGRKSGGLMSFGGQDVRSFTLWIKLPGCSPRSSSC